MNIDHLTYHELLDLNRKIVERLKLMDHIRAHSEMMQFSVGEKVKFSARGGQQIEGMLMKYNKKTVTVVTEEGEHWNVSPHVLTKAMKKTVDITDNVIDLTEKGHA
ncbi:MAG: hypothetical protein HQ523_10435 [Lentisphaerae bacterium]|nr:hypothetical protein [Lentisphaerota bacterium]